MINRFHRGCISNFPRLVPRPTYIFYTGIFRAERELQTFRGQYNYRDKFCGAGINCARENIRIEYKRRGADR